MINGAELDRWLKRLGSPLKAALTPYRGAPFPSGGIGWFPVDEVRVFEEDGTLKAQLVGVFFVESFFDPDVARVYSISGASEADEIWDVASVRFTLADQPEILFVAALEPNWDPTWLTARIETWTRYRETPGAKLTLERIRTRSTPAIATT